MIILKSDYSPQAAADEQEADNMLMLYAALHCAGLSCADMDVYRYHSENSAFYYTAALGKPDEEGKHTNIQWADAKAAAKPYLELAEEVLIRAGITIENKLIKHDDPEHHFHHIETSVYNGESAMNKVAQIERPIIDIESETYQDNKTGWMADFEEEHGNA